MRILVLFAHPRPSASIVQRRLSTVAQTVEGVTFHDLYAAYPDFGIDMAREQDLLLNHDVIVLQHPFYWYSAPAMLKEWQDIVLDFGWAYGPGGNKLHGKYLLQTISTGGAEGFYHHKGRNRFTVDELLRPFNQTAHLCGMAYLAPMVIYEGRRLAEAELQRAADSYSDMLSGLVSGRIAPLSRLSKDFPLQTHFSSASKQAGAKS